MERLNYFHSYTSKQPSHEDQLTRAYMVLLRYSFHSFISFLDFCQGRVKTKKYAEALSPKNAIQLNWSLQTQKSNPRIDSEYLFSVLITDNKMDNGKNQVKKSERNATYDGVVRIGMETTIIVEVKPKSSNVWFDQLNPSRKNLGEETEVVPTPILLQWREIITQLNNILNLSTLSAQEEMMINDFLEFVDEYYPGLNPYESLAQCKNIEQLLFKRIGHILEGVARNKEDVTIHRGWGNIINIEDKFSEIYQIGLILKYNPDNQVWHLELSLLFADTVGQARSFYQRKDIAWKELQDMKWEIRPNFHFSFRSQGLVWFSSKDVPKYIDHWQNNSDSIRQYKRNEVNGLISKLSKLNIINRTALQDKLMRDKFYKTKMSKLNMCPGFGFIYSISASQAIELDNKRELSDFIRKKITELFLKLEYKKQEIKSIIKS